VIGAAVYLYQNTGGEKSGKHGKKDAPVTVSVATAKQGEINIYLNGLGNVAPTNVATLHSRVDGQLMRLLFKEGQFVKEGDLLAELDARPFEAQLDQAQGQMKRDQALLEEAKINLERYKTLFAQDSVAKQQLDAQQSLVKQYEGAVQNDKGQMTNAKLQITYAKITAPFSGQVGLRQVDPGNIVHSGDANGIAVVTQLQPITTIFNLPEDTIPKVMKQTQAGSKIIAEAWDREGKTKVAMGEVSAVDNQVDQSTGTIKLRAQFPNEDNALFPSQFINIRCLVETKKDAVIVPAAAIQHGAQGAFVYLAKADNTVKVQPVKTDATEGETVSIAEGIKPGDIVVTDGMDGLRENAKIEIIAPPVPPLDAKPGALADVPPAASAPEDSGKHKHKRKKDTE